MAEKESFADRAERFVLAQSLRRVVAILVVGIAIIAVLGAFERLGWGFELFDFDGEGKPPAAFSALVLFSAGCIGLLVGRRGPDRAIWFTLLGAFFIFMSADEALKLHEHMEDDFGIDWQIAWAPFILVGGIAWLAVLRSAWNLSRERTLLIAGAVCWFLSQVSERYQANPEEGRVEGYGALSGIEEVLEVSGSALWLVALLCILHAAVGRDRRLYRDGSQVSVPESSERASIVTKS
jgi:hypothetical protein